MLNDLALKQLVTPFSEDGKIHPYFRPYVCNGNKEHYKVFLVGINPATPICEKDKPVDEYLEMLRDNDVFHTHYEQLRLQNGKTKISRTRTAIQSFVNEIVEKTNNGVIVTNVLPYPTKNIKELKTVSKDIRERARGIFKEVLNHYKPKVLVVHGKRSLDELLDVLKDYRIVEYHTDYRTVSIRELENQAPLLRILYENGDEGLVLPCRHFMYYGKEGKSFAEFKKNVFGVLDKGRVENGD